MSVYVCYLPPLYLPLTGDTLVYEFYPVEFVVPFTDEPLPPFVATELQEPFTAEPLAPLPPFSLVELLSPFVAQVVTYGGKFVEILEPITGRTPVAAIVEPLEPFTGLFWLEVETGALQSVIHETHTGSFQTVIDQLFYLNGALSATTGYVLNGGVQIKVSNAVLLDGAVQTGLDVLDYSLLNGVLQTCVDEASIGALQAFVFDAESLDGAVQAEFEVLDYSLLNGALQSCVDEVSIGALQVSVFDAEALDGAVQAEFEALDYSLLNGVLQTCVDEVSIGALQASVFDAEALDGAVQAEFEVLDYSLLNGALQACADEASIGALQASVFDAEALDGAVQAEFEVLDYSLLNGALQSCADEVSIGALQAFVFDAEALDGAVQAEFEVLDYSLLNGVLQTCVDEVSIGALQASVFDVEALDGAVQTKIETLSPIYGAFQMGFYAPLETVLDGGLQAAFYDQKPTPLVLSTENYLIVNGQRIEPIDFTIGTDADSYLWTGAALLGRYEDYALLPVGKAVTLRLTGIDWALEVSGRSHDDGDGAESYRIRFASPSRILEDKTFSISGTWGGDLVSDVAASVAGSAVDWECLNWLLEAGALSADQGIRLNLLGSLADAVGGIIQTRRDGSLVVQPDTPAALNRIETLAPDFVYLDRRDVLTYSESDPSKSGRFNALIISQEAAQSAAPMVEWVEDSSRAGAVRVYPEPWISGIAVECTGHDSVRILTKSIEVFTVSEEIEIKNGVFSASKPVYFLDGYEWQHRDLGDLVWSAGSKELTCSTAGYSVVRVTYRTRCWRFPVEHELTQPELTQFVVRYSDSLTATRIRVKRGAGDIEASEITSPLSQSLPVILECGRVALDYGENWIPASLKTWLNTGVHVGHVVKIFDRRLGGYKWALVRGVQHGIDSNGAAVTQHKLWVRPE